MKTQMIHVKTHWVPIHSSLGLNIQKPTHNTNHIVLFTCWPWCCKWPWGYHGYDYTHVLWLCSSFITSQERLGFYREEGGWDENQKLVCETQTLDKTSLPKAPYLHRNKMKCWGIILMSGWVIASKQAALLLSMVFRVIVARVKNSLAPCTQCPLHFVIKQTQMSVFF